MQKISVYVHASGTKIRLLPARGGVVLFVGEAILQDSPQGPRFSRFLIRQNKKVEVRPPRDALKLLRLASDIRITASSPDAGAFKSMLRAYQLKAGEVEVCPFCLLEGRVKLERSVKLGGQLVCLDCAMRELDREITVRRLGSISRVRLGKLLRRFRDFDRLVGMLDLENLDRELTRYDIVRPNRVEVEMEVESLPLPPVFKEKLRGMKLLPVQMLAVKAGLLEGESLLVISETATGKTLIGELAGITRILQGEGKMLFLVPLVALANQKYRQFTRRYTSLGITTSLRIGVSRINPTRAGYRTTLESDIIVGTYEGIDYLIRTGTGLGRVATVVIDEVHMLEERERGARLDGLIARLKHTHPRAQFLYLSATVGNPRWLADRLEAKLVEYIERPVPIERHLIFTPTPRKTRVINRLARDAWNRTSTKGYRGQTIVFTSSRRNCHKIAESLTLKAAPYHAGLSQAEKQRVEKAFARGELPVVVTTAALGAGVDFPASQVIFESLLMGVEWLRAGEFRQMLGRAGRPDYHDLGLVYLLVDPEATRNNEHEDDVAFRLLEERAEEVEALYTEEEQTEQVLANLTLTNNPKELEQLHRKLIGGGDLRYLLEKIEKQKLINRKLELTPLGRTTAVHFLTPQKTFQIQDLILQGKETTEILTELEILESIHLSTSFNANLPTRIFQGIDLLFSSFKRLDQKMQEKLTRFARDFLTCKCKENPYCGCPEKLFSQHLIELRAQGLGLEQINQEINRDYGVYAYPSDLLSYLEQTARNLEAVEEIAAILKKQETAEAAKSLREKIEG